jgi:hypothetical protein
MMSPKPPPNPGAGLPDSLQTEPPSFSSSNLRLRLARPSAQALKARLAHALRMLDARSAPLVSMLRFRTIPVPSAPRRANGGQRRRL